MLFDKIKFSIFPILGIFFLILSFCLPIMDMKFYHPLDMIFYDTKYFFIFTGIFYFLFYIPLFLLIYSIAIIILGIIKVWIDINNLSSTNQKWYQWSILMIIFYGLYLVTFWFSVFMRVMFPYVIYIPTIALVFPFIGGLLIFIGSFLNRKFMEIEEDKIPKRYNDLEWLRIQYHTLKKSIQEIANEERVSIIEIEKQLKLIDS